MSTYIMSAAFLPIHRKTYSIAIFKTNDLPLFFPIRSRSQTLGSESSLDEGGVFDCLKPDSPASPQQLFSGLVGVPSGSVSSAQFQAAGLVLGSPPEVFIQMTASSREEGGPHRSEGGPFLPRPPQHHHHHHHHFHHQPLQHRTSSLLQQATTAAGSERHGSREEAQEDPSTPAPALSELKAVVTWLQRGFPFILILLAKVCFQHKLGNSACVEIVTDIWNNYFLVWFTDDIVVSVAGIAVCVGMASTFAYANSTFRHQVSLRVNDYMYLDGLNDWRQHGVALLDTKWAMQNKHRHKSMYTR